MKTIAFGTLKGGTGKQQLVLIWLEHWHRILITKFLVDGDPQCNLTNDIGLDCSDMDRNNIRTIFDNKKIDPSELIISGVLEKQPNIDIIPSNILLIKTEMLLCQRSRP